MARFTTKEELEAFLNKIDPRYGARYAEGLWADGGGVGSSSELANATVEMLQRAGVTRELHANNIIMQAKGEGESGGQCTLSAP